jgi:hypothetical protein
MNPSSFAELRENLGALANQCRHPNPAFLGILHQTLGELSSLRKHWTAPRNIVKSPPAIIDIAMSAQPTEMIVVENRPTRSAFAQVPTSSSNNTERYLPIRILWAKVIIRATYDYALWKDSKDMRLRKFAEDAERWLFEPSDHELSFENICFAFDFPVAKIRQKTRSLTRHDVKKLEFRERQGRPELGEASGGDRK